MSSVAILGAGCSGLAAAHILRDKGWSVTLFEREHEVGGRATTLAREGFKYDYGAQYIKRGSPESVAWITERFRASDLLDIVKPVWTFDGKGSIQEGDSAQNAEEKWNYRSGLVMLTKRMAESLDVHLSTPIELARHDEHGWNLVGEQGQNIGTFDRLLLTLPLPQVCEFLGKSHFEPEVCGAVRTVLGTSMYRPLLSIMLGYRPTPRTRPYYALVNSDKRHAISWLAWEHEKSLERVPEGAGLLIAQMAPAYSAEAWGRADAKLIDDCTGRVSRLLDEDLSSPYFSDVQRWQFALPSVLVDDAPLLDLTLPLGLALCGDGFVGGRVHLALEHGMRVARRMADEA
ncbi:NAD(P)/FAD-dependent oxidoreductase [Ktedonospora formicarum]|uniref:FAD-dependent oxidoreductase n=1 Tax=Ktedonospora formicarum TaxID=2778364 RepID=A0A8J3MUE7_9CHLR|nr:FAD-dependent oxidoreductase [Ktedonospora formicarum]GHO46543.1 FAD-dependent oxidoreductase [Ktedonospora formicarum]